MISHIDDPKLWGDSLFRLNKTKLYSPRSFNSLPLKIDGWKMILSFFWFRLICRGFLSVLGRLTSKNTWPSNQLIHFVRSVIQPDHKFGEVLKQQEQRHQQLREELGEVVPRSQKWDRRFEWFHKRSWESKGAPPKPSQATPFNKAVLGPYFLRGGHWGGDPLKIPMTISVVSFTEFLIFQAPKRSFHHQFPACSQPYLLNVFFSHRKGNPKNGLSNFGRWIAIVYPDQC